MEMTVYAVVMQNFCNKTNKTMYWIKYMSSDNN